MRRSEWLLAVGMVLVACRSQSTIPAGGDSSLFETGGEVGPDTGTGGDTGPSQDTGAGQDTSAGDTSAADTGDDTGVMDSGVADTGAMDTGVADTGAMDTGVMDTGVADTGRPDTGFPDTFVVPDTFVPDTFVADTGTIPVDAGTVMEVWVVRVGDGAPVGSGVASPVFIERRASTDGALRGTPIALPTAMAGANNPLTLASTGTSEGALARSADGRFVTLAGYAVAPGRASVASSSTSEVTTDAGVLPAVPRVVARVSADGTVNTTTVLGTTLSGDTARSAVTSNGTAIWAAGAAGGTRFTTLGSTTTPIAVSTSPSNLRTLGIYGGQLYGGASSSGFYGLFAIGTGTPTETGATSTLLMGFPTASGPGTYGFIGLDRSATVPGIDTFYVADDRSPASGGGVQRWTLSGGTWSLGATLNTGIASGVRGVTAYVDGADVVVIATTGENPSRLVSFRDVGGAATSATATPLATAAANTQFRGVALAPAP